VTSSLQPVKAMTLFLQLVVVLGVSVTAILLGV
jgi:hypothetical protein